MSKTIEVIELYEINAKTERIFAGNVFLPYFIEMQWMHAMELGEQLLKYI